MVWHDCKTDTPKKDGRFLVAYWFYRKELNWEVGYWDELGRRFEAFNTEAHWGDGRFVPFKEMYGEPYKWAEVNLLEVK